MYIKDSIEYPAAGWDNRALVEAFTKWAKPKNKKLGDVK